MNYKVKVNGEEIQLFKTTVFHPPYNHPSTMPYAIIVMDKPIDIEIISEKTLEDVLVRPLSLNMEYSFDEHSIYIRLEKAAKFSVEINGSYEGNILIFANDKHDEHIDAASDKVIYFPKGVTEVDVLEIAGDDMTVYLEEGAIVNGKFRAENCNNLTICGYGVLNMSKFPRNGSTRIALEVNHCKNLNIRDITITDSAFWTCRVMGCDDVHIENINILGWRGNSDGIDICGSRNVLVEKCFLRTWDDCFVAKAFDTGDLENITFRDSALWNDFARPLEVGVEIRADHARNITFENIDVMHSVTGYPILGIHHGDRAELRNIRFENIRIEDAPGAQIFDIRITDSVWNDSASIGDIDGITIKDIYLVEDQEVLPSRSRLQGYSPEVKIKNVTLENINFLGKFATTPDECQVNVMDFVENVAVKYPESAEKILPVKSAVEVTEEFSLNADGLYEGKVALRLSNENDEPVSGKVYLQVSPKNMVEIPDNSFSYNLKKGEDAVKEYALKLQPGKYALCIQSTDVAVEASWKYLELVLVLGEDINAAPTYKIVNYYGNEINDVQLAAKEDALIIKSEALRDAEFTVYSAMPVPALPGEMKFSVEETDFGEAMAILDGAHGLEAAPQLRCPAEITYVFKNEPKVKEIRKNTIGGKGESVAFVSFKDLGIDPGSKALWFDISAEIPEVQGNRRKFTMFHSPEPEGIAHMFARAVIK